MKKADCYFLGSVTKVKGMKGEVNCYLDVDNPAKYKKLESVYVDENHQLIPFFIERIQLTKKNQAIFKFEDINTPEQAEELINKKLFLPLSLLPKKKGNQFYFHEVIGFTVNDTEKGNIGTISSVLDNNLDGILQINQDQTEILIPINDKIILKVDRKKEIIFIEAPAGLIDLYVNNSNDLPL